MLRFLVLILLKFLFIMYVMIFLSKMWICKFSRQIKGTTGGVLKKTLTQLFSYEFCEILKNTYFIEHLRKATFRQMPIFLAHFIIIIERPMKDFYTMNLTHFCLMFSFSLHRKWQKTGTKMKCMSLTKNWGNNEDVSRQEEQ